MLIALKENKTETRKTPNQPKKYTPAPKKELSIAAVYLMVFWGEK